MKGNLFQDDKGVHIKIRKDIHAHFRGEMFKMGLSMQEAFNEFALQVVEGTKSSKHILSVAALKKMKTSINDSAEKSSRRKKEKEINAFDIDTLYELINTKISESK